MVGRPWKLPDRIAAVGTVVRVGLPLRRAKFSHDVKKKNLSLTTGPPAVIPYWFCVKELRGTPDRLLKKSFAFSTRLRRNSYALPWNWFVPDLVAMLTTPPEKRPNSGVTELLSTRNSWIASWTGTMPGEFAFTVFSGAPSR